MNFTTLCSLITIESKKKSFSESVDQIQKVIFSLDKQSLIPIITEIGIIPEYIEYDSKEEKLYTKISDIVLAKCFYEFGLPSSVYKERSNCADVISHSQIYNYSLVSDAKAFRLSRTAKNQKDFKIKSMVDWRGNNDFAVLVCPAYQYPKQRSQIYGQAIDGNIALFSWELLSVLLTFGIIETPEINLSGIWSVSSKLIKEKNYSFISDQNDFIIDYLNIDKAKFYDKYEEYHNQTIMRSEQEIKHYERVIENIKNYKRKKAVDEVLRITKPQEKINSINKLIMSLR